MLGTVIAVQTEPLRIKVQLVGSHAAFLSSGLLRHRLPGELAPARVPPWQLPPLHMLFDDAPMDGVTRQASEAISVASSSSHILDQGGIQEEAGVLGSGSGQRDAIVQDNVQSIYDAICPDDDVVDDDRTMTLDEVLATVGSRFRGPSGVGPSGLQPDVQPLPPHVVDHQLASYGVLQATGALSPSVQVQQQQDQSTPIQPNLPPIVSNVGPPPLPLGRESLQFLLGTVAQVHPDALEAHF